MDESQKKTVLLVDDDTEFTNNFSEILQTVGLKPVVAITAKEALDYIRDHTVDFIVLDFVMPEMDGSAVHELISHDMRKNIPTIILTNFPNATNIPQDLQMYVKVDTDLNKLAEDIKKRLGELA